MQEIAIGLCQCGCGGKTRISPYNNKTRGDKKGFPRRFINFHQSRLKGNSQWNGGETIKIEGYVKIKSPLHPHKDSKGYVSQHRLIAEKALGRLLKFPECVHHVNTDKSDNFTPFNLIVCEDENYHRLLHRRTRALKECGHADWERCAYCGLYNHSSEMERHAKSQYCHRKCKLNYGDNYRDSKKGGNAAS